MSFIPIDHTNPAFSEAIAEIDGLLSQMFTQAERALTMTCEALERDDVAMAKQVIGGDDQINGLDDAVSEKVATALARHQPVARDLHALMGAVKLGLELERLADHAKNICRRLVWLHKHDLDRSLFMKELLSMGHDTVDMLREFIQAEQKEDLARTIKVRKHDKKVNDTYHDIFRQVYDVASEDPRLLSLVNSLFVAKNFERVGDKIKNMVELAHYQRTGANVEFDDEDNDEQGA